MLKETKFLSEYDQVSSIKEKVEDWKSNESNKTPHDINVNSRWRRVEVMTVSLAQKYKFLVLVKVYFVCL